MKNLQKILAGRAGYILGALISFGLVGLALFLQTRYALEPCPLCISQRITYLTLGALFIFAAVFNPRKLGRKLLGGLHILTALIGAGIALRHMWIQAHPDQVMGECGAGFDYIFERFPLRRALDLVFKGTGECSAIDWTLFGLTIPQLSLIAFLGLGAYALGLLVIKPKD